MRVNVGDNVGVSTQPLHGIHFLSKQSKLSLVGHHHTLQACYSVISKRGVDGACIDVRKTTLGDVLEDRDLVRANGEPSPGLKHVWGRSHGQAVVQLATSLWWKSVYL